MTNAKQVISKTIGCPSGPSGAACKYDLLPGREPGPAFLAALKAVTKMKVKGE